MKLFFVSFFFCSLLITFLRINDGTYKYYVHLHTYAHTVLNVEGGKSILKAAKQLILKVMHFLSSYVFDLNNDLLII